MTVMSMKPSRVNMGIIPPEKVLAGVEVFIKLANWVERPMVSYIDVAAWAFGRRRISCRMEKFSYDVRSS